MIGNYLDLVFFLPSINVVFFPSSETRQTKGVKEKKSSLY